MQSKTSYWALSAGPLVTLSLGSGITSDPNIFKLLVLGIISSLSLGSVIMDAIKNPVILKSQIFVISYFFILALFVPIFFSDAPIAQQIFGTYGRNLGFLHYFFLTVIMLGISRLNFKAFVPSFLKSIVGVGVFESIYATIQFFGYDPIPWKNTDKWVFGTFGNPNYLSSFLSLSVITTTYFALINRRNKYRIFFAIGSLFQLISIFLTASTQGLILVSIGFCALIIHHCFNYSTFLGWAILSIGSLTAIFAVYGIFQSGPLAPYLYQESVSFRGDYWRAGLRMFQANWTHGVGLDSYGDFYRMYRDELSAHRRGLEIVSNSAHNLLIDLSATGGVVLLIAYLILIIIMILKIVNMSKPSEGLTPDSKLLIILWVLFNLQTLISINIPSLAVWGWIISGLIFSYDKFSNSTKNGDQRFDKRLKNTQLRIKLSCSTLLILIMFPLVSRDIKFSTALSKNDITEIASVAAIFPRDSNQISSVAKAFEKIGRNKQAFELAKIAVQENLHSSIAWQIIYESEYANLSEKVEAKKALIKLDPYYTLKFD